MAKQTKLPQGFIKVGRISMTIAREAHIKAADIVTTENYLIHIGNKHKSQLQPLGLNAFDYIKIVLAQFTEIREAERNAVLMVKQNPGRSNDTVVIELTLNYKLHLWEARTAQPRSDVSKNKLLWRKGNGKPTKDSP
jgi:hypothetical protein